MKKSAFYSVVFHSLDESESFVSFCTALLSPKDPQLVMIEWSSLGQLRVPSTENQFYKQYISCTGQLTHLCFKKTKSQVSVSW